MARRLSSSERPADAPNDSLEPLEEVTESRGGFAGGGEIVEPVGGASTVSYGCGDSDVDWCAEWFGE